jgi:hypothetical protein
MAFDHCSFSARVASAKIGVHNFDGSTPSSVQLPDTSWHSSLSAASHCILFNVKMNITLLKVSGCVKLNNRKV